MSSQDAHMTAQEAQMTTGAPRVLLAEHLCIIRQGLRALLETSSFEVVAEPADGPEAIRMARRTYPDAAILDFSIPKWNGIETARRLCRLSRPVPSLLLTTSRTKADLALTLAAGVKGYILKSQSGSQLIEALWKVLRGGLYISPLVGSGEPGVLSSETLHAASLTEQAMTGQALTEQAMTEQERLVLKMVAEGKANREVGHMLALTPAAVKRCRTRIMAKLEVRETAALVRYAVRHGIIQP